MSNLISKTKNKHFALLVLILLVALFLDQFSKIYLSAVLSSPLSIFGDIFSLRLEHNIGLAFSITFFYPLQLAANLIFFAAILYFLLKNLDFNKLLSQIIFALLTAGALGNLLDRFRLGYVIDFISVGNFPVFNLADSYITVSVFLLLLFYDKIKRPKTNSHAGQ